MLPPRCEINALISGVALNRRGIAPGTNSLICVGCQPGLSRQIFPVEFL
jgi:hypothetical protein